LRLSGISHSSDELIDSYKSGNLNKVIYSRDSILLPSLAPEEDDEKSHLSPSELAMATTIDTFFRQYMIDQRNRRMAARVINLLVNQPGKHISSPSGPGIHRNNSILDIVASAGYKIDHIQPGASLYESNAVYRSHSSKATVQGTFSDLSENEKTRALLQFLQHQQQQKKTEETQKFQKLLGGTEQQGHQEKPYLDDKKSLNIWYGIEGLSSSKSPQSSPSIYLPMWSPWVVPQVDISHPYSSHSWFSWTITMPSL
ncbi:Metalloprotease TIKI1like, partial [Caligus rogercresseyi]